jgi:hypothetical protein
VLSGFYLGALKMNLTTQEIIGSSGVALTAIGGVYNWAKSIYKRIDKLSDQITALSKTIAALDKTVAVLSDRLDRL